MTLVKSATKCKWYLWLLINEIIGSLFRGLGIKRFYPFWTKYDLRKAYNEVPKLRGLLNGS